MNDPIGAVNRINQAMLDVNATAEEAAQIADEFLERRMGGERAFLEKTQQTLRLGL
jgi:hypothetical protein